MSRIGKQPITIPAKVKVEVKGQKVLVEGPKGKLDFDLPKRTSLAVKDGIITVSRAGDDAESKALHGLSRALVNNMVKGVTDGFIKKLEIQGVGFKAAVTGKVVNLALGFSHPIEYPIPPGIAITVDKQTHVVISGVDRQLVGQTAANIRGLKKPDPYKQKGIRYTGERLKKKAGKAGGK